MTNSGNAGRPTNYDASYCRKVIELGKQGKSYEQIALILNIGLRTLFTWRNTHEEFQHALKDAKTFEMAFWEDIAQAHLVEVKNAPRLNTGLWSRSMAARFPNKYSERLKKEEFAENQINSITGFKIILVKPNEAEEEC